MDAGHEETRWPARVSQASVAEGGESELKKGAAKAGDRPSPAARQPECTQKCSVAWMRSQSCQLDILTQTTN